MMPQGIIRNSLGDASRHHQGVKGFNHQLVTGGQLKFDLMKIENFRDLISKHMEMLNFQIPLHLHICSLYLHKKIPNICTVYLKITLF